MPFQVETVIKPSPLHGRGLFTKVPIKQGEVIWTFLKTETSKPVDKLDDEAPNKAWTQEQLEKQSPERIRQIFHGGSPHCPSNVYVQLRDGSNFINNLKDSNIEIKFNERQELEYSVAKRDIEAGEELTENYADEKAAQLEWVDELMQKYCPDRYAQDNL